MALKEATKLALESALTEPSAYTEIKDDLNTINDGAFTPTTLAVSSTSTFSDFVATADDKGLQIGTAGIGGLTASLQTTGTIAIADDSVQVGKYCTVSADAQTLTLPAVVIGASFIIVNIADDGGALLTISPNASDKFLVDIAGAAGTNNKDIINTKATQKKYDYVHLIGAHADGWLIHDIRGTWVDEA
jgi:ribose 5-phosphate isomerase RpiB